MSNNKFHFEFKKRTPKIQNLFPFTFIFLFPKFQPFLLIFHLNKSKTPPVRTQFVTNHNSVGFARKKAQTISFVERGFERLGLGHEAVGFSWCSYMVKLSSPLESFSWRWAGRLWFFAIFSSPLVWCTNLFIIQSFLVDPSPPLIGQAGAYFCIYPINRPLLLSISCEDRSYTVQTSFLINRIWTLAGAFNAEGTHFP